MQVSVGLVRVSSSRDTASRISSRSSNTGGLGSRAHVDHCLVMSLVKTFGSPHQCLTEKPEP